MALRAVGRTGLSLSAVGLGGVELGPFVGTQPDVRNAVNVINAAFDAGINWLDTSENYLDSQNETLIGEALVHGPEGMLVSTKVSPRPAISGGGSGFRRDQVRSACTGSLRRLRRDHIDIYLLHFPDDLGVPLDETWGAMSELVDDGLVGAIGLSNYAIEEIASCHAQRRVDVIQDGLNLLDYLENRSLFARCGELGIAGTVFDSLSSAVLTNRSRTDVLDVWETYAAHGWTHPLLAADKIEPTYAVVDGLRPIAARLAATVAQVAIAWILLQPGVISALAGTSSPTRVRENAGAATVDVTEELEEIERVMLLGAAFASPHEI